LIASLKRAVTRIVSPKLVAAVIPYSQPGMSAGDWDREYSSDVWKRLHSVGELGRYSLIVGYCNHYRPGGSVLEIGCGEGLLAQRLSQAGVTRYLGVDVSASAIETAGKLGLAGHSFVAADAAAYQPPADGSQDLLVFNETLYYFDAPAHEAARYARCLNPEGLMVVSLENVVRGHQIWSMLRKGFMTLDEVRVTHGRLSWDVRVLKPIA
jgi:SAM-dependent methyltransferase